MRRFNLKSITHSSGESLPLLCIENDQGKIEWALQAIPLVNIAESTITACLKPGHSNPELAEIEKYFFDLSLSFASGINNMDYKTPFITKGTLQLVDFVKNEMYRQVEYAGIKPSVRLDVDIYEQLKINEFITSESSSVHIINKFCFIHPDDPTVEKSYVMKAPLKDVFNIAGVKLEKVVKYFSFNRDSMKYEPLVVLQKSRNKTRGVGDAAIMLEKNGEIINPNNRLFFNKATKINTLVHSDLIATKLSHNNVLHTALLLPELAVINILQKPDLPLNEQIKPGIYKDRKKTDLAWYQDFFSLLRPATGTSFLVSPFQFLFRVKGLDPQGKPVLESEITISLKCDKPVGTETFSAGNLKSIAKKNLSVIISIPFTDNNGNQKTSDIISSSISQQGETITARFILNNEWTRVAYAAISVAGNASRPVKLKISYLFDVYTKVNKQQLNIVSLHKLDKIQIMKTAPRGFKPSANVFIAAHNTVMTPAGMSIKYETAVTPQKINTLHLASTAHLVNLTPQNPAPIPAEVEYKIDSLLYNNEIEVQFPCTEFGEYYQEESGDLLTPIGCREPYRLGEVSPKLYTELTELRTGAYNVYRSNQVPNRFLVFPKRYIISRNSKDLPSPFAPNLVLYSTFDVNNLMDSHSVLNTVLQPDIEYYNIIKLTKILKNYTSYEPDVLFINEIESEKTYRWTLPESLYVSNTAVAIGNFINYSLVCEVEKALTVINMLKSANQGINGTINYVLPDGTQLQSTININIREIEGPWFESPLHIRPSANTIELENLLGEVIDIAGLHSEHSGEQVFDTLNLSLAGKTKTIVPLAGRTNVVAEYLVHQGDGNVSEVHSYSENIGCQLIFIDTSDKDTSTYDPIKIQYSLVGDSNFLSANMTNDTLPVEVILPIPLTKYLSERIIRYRLQATKKADNSVVESPWQTLDLSGGNIIDLNTQINTFLI